MELFPGTYVCPLHPKAHPSAFSPPFLAFSPTTPPTALSLTSSLTKDPSPSTSPTSPKPHLLMGFDRSTSLSVCEGFRQGHYALLMESLVVQRKKKKTCWW
ncbi:hypothetical protein AAC387_Pa08g1619 [Persea americana]